MPSLDQTHSSMQFNPTLKMGCYHLQRKNFYEQSSRLNNPDSFSQTISNSANLQSKQTPQTWSYGSQGHLPYISTASSRHTPNIVSYASLQAGPLTLISNQDTLVLNSTIPSDYTNLYFMQNVNCSAPHCSALSVPTNADGVSEKSYYIHGSIPWQHLVNRQNHSVHASHQPAAQSQQASHMPVDSLLHSQFRPSSSQMNQSQAENAVRQPSSYRKCAGYTELKHTSRQTSSMSHRARLTSDSQNQLTHRLNQACPSLAQDKIQSYTSTISGYHSKTKLATFSAIQSSTRTQDLESYTVSELTKISQDKTKISSQSSPTSHSGQWESIKKQSSHNLLRRLLQQNYNSQVTGLTSSSNHFGSQSTNIKSESQQSPHDAGHITTGESWTQDKILNTAFDLSTVPVGNHTLKELTDLENSLEVQATVREKSKITDVGKCLVDLYYDGNKQNFVTLLALKGLFKTLWSLEPKHLNMMEKCSQILINDNTLTSEDFKSSWLNVDGQPADVDNVLEEADDISDDNLTSGRKVAKSVDAVDELPQMGTNNTEYLGVQAHKGIPKSTAEDVPEESFYPGPEHSMIFSGTTDCKADMLIPEKGSVDRTSCELSGTRCRQQLHDDVDVAKENQQAFTEPSLISSSDPGETNNSYISEKTDLSDEAGSTHYLSDIMLLPSEDARNTCSKNSDDQKAEPHQIFHWERKDLVTHCVKKESDSVKEKPLNDFRFTCPHVTSLACVSDFFCPSCWNEMPLLYIDQDETLLTMKEEKPHTDHQRRGSSPQTGKLIKHPSGSCPESNSMIDSTLSSLKSNGSDVMRDPKAHVQTQSFGLQPAQEPQHGVPGNSRITEPVEEHFLNSVLSPGTKAEHLNKQDVDSPSGTKKITGMFSLSRDLFPNAKVPQTNDIPFSPNILTKNTNAHNQQPGDHRSLSTDDHQCRDISVESSVKQKYLDRLSPKTKLGTSSQMANISEAPKCNNAAPHKQKRTKGHSGENAEKKKLRLESYGSDGSIRGYHYEKR